MEIDKNNHLKEVLDTHKMYHVQDFVNKVKTRREEIKSKMHNHYGNDKYSSFGSGSFAKHTATNVKFDLDLVEPFKHSAFGTLQEMFDSVHNFLAEEYKNTGVTIRKQKVSIGVIFPIEEGDEKHVELDVVPGRELNDDDYLESHDLNLCFNEDHWGFKKGTSQKTNIQKQISHIEGKSSEREIIRLLKIWKKQKSKKYKSFVIELAVIKALDGYNGNKGLWARLRFVMEYLRDHIANSSFHLYDPGNSNNDVMAAMADYDRESFKSDMETMLNNIDSNPDFYLPYYFKANERYSGYKEKERGTAYPTSPKRFG
ncbi:nucleotidyltransferase family protein [Bacteroides thetaiotaomicron]|uniref:hypothetical protein n=1 Tax=Bacteroides thetaiotaomicron TaxID=818 RepID=UPI001F36179D|nr:hypothetical protein [Bacteroides thetaiotaomicron]MCE8952368.1 hypothetical protein [Bacteroides thetaiotaomicron]MCE8969724.1 hypothetical protein [Bacteroides thetaiotaomicron]